MADRPDPTVALVMGRVKLGKTASVLWAFPQAFCIAAPGALKAAESTIGYAVPANRRKNAETASDVVKVLEDGVPQNAPAVLVDDLTLIVDNSIRDYEKRGVIKWNLWRAIRNDLLDIRRTARAKNKHVVFTLHETEPKYEEINMPGGNKRRDLIEPGGPALPGQMKQGLPAICDMILHAVRSDSFVSMWPTVFRNPVLDPRYVGIGLRELPPVDPLPDNIAEILRAAGHVLAEPFPGHGEATEKLSSAFIANPDKIRVLAELATAKLDARFASAGERSWVRRNWVLRDALARAQLALSLQQYRSKPTFYGQDAGGDI